VFENRSLSSDPEHVSLCASKTTGTALRRRTGPGPGLQRTTDPGARLGSRKTNREFECWI